MPPKIFKIEKGVNTTKIHFQEDKAVIEICKLKTTTATSFIAVGDEMHVSSGHAVWNPKQRGVRLKDHKFPLLAAEEKGQYVDASEVLCINCFHGVCDTMERHAEVDHPEFYKAAKSVAVMRLYVNVADKMFEMRLSKDTKIRYSFENFGIKEIVDKCIVAFGDE